MTAALRPQRQNQSGVVEMVVLPDLDHDMHLFIVSKLLFENHLSSFCHTHPPSPCWPGMNISFNSARMLERVGYLTLSNDGNNMNATYVLLKSCLPRVT